MTGKCEPKKTILVVSLDTKLADIRKHVLQDAGFHVVEASHLKAVVTACHTGKIDLVMIGYSLPPAEKRRVWVEVRKHCKVAVLELHQGGKAEMMQEANTFTHRSETPSDFLAAAERILRAPRRRR